jgi:hypothetical protein
MIKHKHHIIPKHMGGTDDPSNLVELTIQEHADAHKKLWEEHKNHWDRIAWLALSGAVHTSEVSKLVQYEACKRAGIASAKGRQAKGESIEHWIQKNGQPYKFSKEDCIKGAKKAGKIGAKVMNSQIWMCLECGYAHRPASLGWHMKRQNHILKVQI